MTDSLSSSFAYLPPESLSDRLDQLEHWVHKALEWLGENTEGCVFEPLPGDASFRRYVRVHLSAKTFMAVDAPIETENNEAFVAIASAWYQHGVHVPQIFAFDLSCGFMLQEDFGQRLFSDRLIEQSASTQVHPIEVADTSCALYRQALDELLNIQRINMPSLPIFDKDKLHQEMALFSDWLCQSLLGLSLSSSEKHQLEQLYTCLSQSALKQPQVVVHRDYHARNLMLCNDGALGVIDFQDAVMGPWCYDLVSLIKDCYTRLPKPMVETLVHEFWQQSPHTEGRSLCEFKQDVDFMGAQRHLKAAGIFARLWLRDGRRNYLNDIPNTCLYLQETARHYQDSHDVMAWFSQWFDERFFPALTSASL